MPPLPPLLLLLPLLLMLLPAATLGQISEAATGDLSNFMEMEEWQPGEDPEAPLGTVWHNGSYLYMPAPPGRSPACARGGMTYCASIPTYPGEVIERLLIRWKYDLSTVFSSENRDTLTSGIARNTSVPTPPAVPPSQPPGRSYGAPPMRSYGPPGKDSTPASSYGPLVADVPARTYGLPVRGGTPIRGYSVPFAGTQTFSQTQFRPIQGQHGRPIDYGADVTSLGDLASQDGPNLVYTVPSTRQKPPSEHRPSDYKSAGPEDTWTYSFSVPSSRQRRQADSAGQLCPTAGQFVMPRAGLNNRGEWRFLINMGELDQQYTQLIRSEQCLSSRCSGLCTLPAGMTATCQQQYVQKKLVGLNPTGGEMYTDLYWIPHCCVCQIS